jgi:hypothetical protein
MLGHQRAEKSLIFGFVFPGKDRVPRQHAVAESIEPRRLITLALKRLNRPGRRIHRRDLLRWSTRSMLARMR